MDDRTRGKMGLNRQQVRSARQDQRRDAKREARRQRLRSLVPLFGRQEQYSAERPTSTKQWSWTRIGLTIAAGTAIILAAVRLAFWFFLQQTTPLPGGGIPTNGNQHVGFSQLHGAYFTNPPTSGWHFDELPRPGVYTNPRLPEGLAHFMEHGGVWVLYNCPDTCDELVGELADLTVRQTDGDRPVAVAPYPPPGYERPAQRINVIAWQSLLSLDEFDRDTITDFVERRACNYSPEGGPYCRWRRGSTASPVDAGSGGFSAAPGGPTPATGVVPVTATPAAAGPPSPSTRTPGP